MRLEGLLLLQVYRQDTPAIDAVIDRFAATAAPCTTLGICFIRGTNIDRITIADPWGGAIGAIVCTVGRTLLQHSVSFTGWLSVKYRI